MAGSTFPLRFRHERVRELVRLVAEREGISQNELLEQDAKQYKNEYKFRSSDLEFIDKSLKDE